jgi:hypothetical protein
MMPKSDLTFPIVASFIHNRITKISIIILPIKDLIIIILSGTLDPLILGFDESVPLSPARILLFKSTLFVYVSLLITD